MFAERDRSSRSVESSSAVSQGRHEASGSPRGRLGAWLGVGLLGLFVLHQDFWNWQSSELTLGLPTGLLYHLVYCFAVAIYMAVLLRFSPPLEPPS